MEEKHLNELINYINNNLEESDRLWDSKESNAYIIGYLQGTLKSLVDKIEIIKKIK
jgi:hypothetical protein